MKRTLYLETSIWSRLGDPEASTRRGVTAAFVETAARHHRILISNMVIAELGRTPNRARRADLVRRMWESRPERLPYTRRVRSIAEELLTAGGWTESHLEDMVHVAYTLVAGVDALVTWDEDDLARDRTRTLVQAYARRKRLQAPLIGTPEEVSAWLGIVIA